MTTSPNFRNRIAWHSSYNGSEIYDFPIIRKQDLSELDFGLLAYSDTTSCETKYNRKNGVHFFIDDYRFTGIYRNPKKSLPKLAQYKFLLSPDDSLYAEMGEWEQIAAVGRNRWVGSYWQKEGLTVYPTVSWGNPHTFRFCFAGIEKGSYVAVGMNGCKHSKKHFMYGYDAMLEYIQPTGVICFGSPFAEMRNIVKVVDYIDSRKKAR